MSDADLVHRVALTTGLSRSEAKRVVEDVVAWHSETVPAYVRRRHGECQRAGLRNDAAFRLIGREVQERVFASLPLSERQLRRIVYG